MGKVSIVGLGAGGHAKVVLEILGANPSHEIMGLLDRNLALHGTELIGNKIIGGDELLPSLAQSGVTHFFIGLGSICHSEPRQRLYEIGVKNGLIPITAIHPFSSVSNSSTIGVGATIMAGAVINAGARLGVNVIVNSGAIIEHDCILEDHAHVATGACLAGAVTVGCGAHVGAGATVRQSIRIGEGALVGAGAVVVTDVPAGVTVAGVPARRLVARKT